MICPRVRPFTSHSCRLLPRLTQTRTGLASEHCVSFAPSPDNLPLSKHTSTAGLGEHFPSCTDCKLSQVVVRPCRQRHRRRPTQTQTMKLKLPYEAPPAVWEPVDIAISRPTGIDPGADIPLLACAPFPVNQMYMLDLDCFDQSFFSPRQPGVSEWFDKAVVNPLTPLRGNFNDHAMWYHQSHVSKGKGTTWLLCKHKQSSVFAKVISASLEKVAGKPTADPACPPRKRNPEDPTDFTHARNNCGLLTTIKQSVQAPHSDISDAAMKRFRTFNDNHGLSPACVP